MTLDRHSATTQRAALRLVPLEEHPRSEQAPFCGHCGVHPATPLSSGGSRVCRDCGLGLILEADVEVAPHPGDAFLVFDGYLSVCAVSSVAEQLLAMTEMDLVTRHISEVLIPADVEAQSTSNLASAVMWAAHGDDVIRRMFVRPASTFGVRLSARIASCGPANAALVVLG
jgi:hypothetical protein